MKKNTILFYFLSIFTLITSCSNEATENPSKSLLKSYNIYRDSQGKYSIDYNLNENVTSEFVKNAKTHTNEFYLFSKTNTLQKQFNKVLLLDKNKLKVDFLENNIQKNSVTIYDKNIILARGKEYNEYLESYSIESTGNDYYQVDFKVKEGVETKFIYNEKNDTYEIHLEKGNAKNLIFSKKYKKSSETLKIDFVNHHEKNTSARSGTKKLYSLSSEIFERRPRVVIRY